VAQGYFSDFDLMVIVGTETQAADETLWTKVADDARAIGGRIPVTLLVHDIKQFNHEIRTGQYFYSDVVNEGVVLFDSRRFMLARVKAHTPAERLELGRRNFSYWFQSANEFWRGAGYYASRGLGPHAAFSLHQATERYFHAALLVFTGYKPKTHDIEALAKQTAPLHAALEDALPRTDPENQRLFGLLKRAYIEARYSKSYSITAEELAILRRSVLDLAVRVRLACTVGLSAILGADAVGSLPLEPTHEDSVELPSLPSLDDSQAVQTWRDALVRISYSSRADLARRFGADQLRAWGVCRTRRRPSRRRAGRAHKRARARHRGRPPSTRRRAWRRGCQPYSGLSGRRATRSLVGTRLVGQCGGRVVALLT
jgi:HEPN domain-containing protein